MGILKDCKKCGGECCKYIALEIDCPEDLGDFENIKWYVIHEKVRVYVESNHSWNLQFLTPCKYLFEKGKCKIHSEAKRPQICKDFSVEECPFHNGQDELYSFESIEDVENYIDNIFKKGLHILPEDESED